MPALSLGCLFDRSCLGVGQSVQTIDNRIDFITQCQELTLDRSQILVEKEKAVISGPKAAIAAAVTAGAYTLSSPPKSSGMRAIFWRRIRGPRNQMIQLVARIMTEVSLA